MSKVPKAIIYQGLARILDNTADPPISVRFFVASPSHGIFKYLRVVDPSDPYIVQEVPKSAVAAELSKYVSTYLKDSDQLQLTARDADQAVDAWTYLTKTVPEPEPFIWPGDTRLAYARMPWRAVCASTPIFDEMFSRMTNSMAAMQWIGSLFDKKADRSQYLWIFGEGKNGKSSLANFLKQILGRSYAGASVPAKDDKHWTHGIVNKRLVCFADCSSYGFPASAQFKLWTGGDQVQINPKNRDMYYADLIAKFLFLSNTTPKLSSESADRRRAIYSEMAEITKDPDPEYQDKLWDEGGAFLGKCIDLYQTHCPKGGVIKTNTVNLDDLIEETEEKFEAAFSKHFSLGPELFATSNAVASVIQSAFRDEHQQREFREWMRRKGKLGKSKPTYIKEIGGTVRAYAGLACRYLR